jgi:hypothetical protein
MLADELDYVVGVDTHLDEHVLAVVVAPLGRRARATVRASAHGYSAALQFARQIRRRARLAIEGTGSYGAGLARYLPTTARQCFTCMQRWSSGGHHRRLSRSCRRPRLTGAGSRTSQAKLEFEGPSYPDASASCGMCAG